MLGGDAEPEDVEDLLCGPIATWLPEHAKQKRRTLTAANDMMMEFISMVNKIMKTKKADERKRQRPP